MRNTTFPEPAACVRCSVTLSHCKAWLNLICLALPTRAGSFCLVHPVNFTCGRKLEKTHDFRLFSHEDWVRVALGRFSLRFESATLEVKGKCANGFATEAPWLLHVLSPLSIKRPPVLPSYQRNTETCKSKCVRIIISNGLCASQCSDNNDSCRDTTT